ncbi:MAG: rhodanese-like domain-containing protein [Gallionella sp.]
MKSYDDLVNEVLGRVREVLPWDLGKQLAAGRKPLLLDIREPGEYAKLRIPGSINVPRGVLEQSCEWDYDETVPELAAHRERDIVLICRSGKRSVLAADVLQQMGFTQVASLKLGIRGWNDAELPLEDDSGNSLDADAGDVLLEPGVSPAQRNPSVR